MQLMPSALHLARLSAGNSMAARMAMMAMTTSNSISVKPVLACFIVRLRLPCTRFTLFRSPGWVGCGARTQPRRLSGQRGEALVGSRAFLEAEKPGSAGVGIVGGA